MDWHERINAAMKCGSFTQKDKAMAGRWVTCACGEQDPRIPRKEGGAPHDTELDGLGMKFELAVITDDITTAIRVLAKIERRAGEILAEVKG